MSEKKQVIGLSLSPKIIDDVDRRRGSVSRSSFIEEKIREALGIKELVLDSCDEILAYLAERTPPKNPKAEFSFHALMVVREVEKRLLQLKNEILQRT